MRTRFLRIPSLIAVGAVLAAGGCTSNDGEETGTSAPSGEPSGSVLSVTSVGGVTLLVNQVTGAYMDAIVSGTLATNSKQCVTVGGDLLLAPAGSLISDGGQLRLSGWDPADLGDKVEWGGGLQEDTPVSSLDDAVAVCVDDGAETVTLAVVAPGQS